MYYFSNAAIILVSEWQTKCLKRGLRCQTLLGVVYVEVASCCGEGFCDAGMSRGFVVKAVYARHKADGIYFKEIPSLAEQRVILGSLDTERTGDICKGLDDDGNSWNFEGMVTNDDGAKTGICAKVREVQRLCKVGDEAVSTTIVDINELAHECIEVSRMKARMFDQHTDLETNLKGKACCRPHDAWSNYGRERSCQAFKNAATSCAASTREVGG